MVSKLSMFWKKNRSAVIQIVRLLFLLQTLGYLVLTIVYLSLGDPITATGYFVGAVVSGSITFALLRSRSGTLI